MRCGRVVAHSEVTLDWDQRPGTVVGHCHTPIWALDCAIVFDLRTDGQL